MKLKTMVWILLLALLAFLSGEILLRRFWWGQIPSQLSPWFVYSILALNGFVLAYLVSGLVGRGAQTRMEKN